MYTIPEGRGWYLEYGVVLWVHYFCMDCGWMVIFVPAPVQNGGEYSFEAVHGSGAKYFAFDSMKVLVWVGGYG